MALVEILRKVIYRFKKDWKQHKWFWVVAGVMYGLVIVRVMKSVIEGSIPFWYDPARDVLAGLDSLSKPTLLGPPTGIPGLFYGPYWIWMLAVGVAVVGNPRWIDLLVQVLPYLVLLPVGLVTLGKMWGRWVSLSLLILFLSRYVSYLLFLWNPHLAPLMYVGLVVLIANRKKWSDKRWYFGLLGLVAGLIVNFHFSFGVVLVLATASWLVGWSWRRVKWIQMVKRLVIYGLGVALVFVPFGVFEVRHGFNQIMTLMSAVNKSFIQADTVVGMSGMSKVQIIDKVVKLPAVVLGADGVGWLVAMVLGAGLGWLVIRKKIKRNQEVWSHVLLVVSMLMAVYLLSHNPVWDYHFIGMEMVVLMLVGLVVSEVRFLKLVVVSLAVVMLARESMGVVRSFEVDPRSYDSLVAREQVVLDVVEKTRERDFKMMAYSPGVYVPEWEYLFWLFTGERDKLLVQGETPDLVYLILPWTTQDLGDDFVNYKTPNESYVTANYWEYENGWRVYERKLELSSE